MVERHANNYAFVDAQNLYLGVLESGWKIDYKRFRVYLKEKYGVQRAFMFLGFAPNNQGLYTCLQNYGYILIFKPIVWLEDGYMKGNCDAELVLHTMINLEEFQQAIIITGDGDFYCLVKYLDEQGKLCKVLAPSPKNCSSLLTKITGHIEGKRMSFVSDLRNKLEYKKKNAP